MATQVCITCAVLKQERAFPTSRKYGRGRECRDCIRQRRVGRVLRRPEAAAPSPAQTAPAAPAAPVKRTTAATDFVPPKDVVATFAAARMIAAEGIDPVPNLHFIGPSGSGKTELAKKLAADSGLPFFKVDAPSMVDPESWFGTREVEVRDGAPMTVFHESEFIRAVTQRCVLLVDEFNRSPGFVRQIMLGLLDDTRQVTNPLTGQVVVRHPECFMILTSNVGLSFTDTHAIDPAFRTRVLTSRVDYLSAAAERKLAASRTGCTPEIADLFVRVAQETRAVANQNEDFPPMSTREVLNACRLVAQGLAPKVAFEQVMLNAASTDGGGESVHSRLELIWAGQQPK